VGNSESELAPCDASHRRYRNRANFRFSVSSEKPPYFSSFNYHRDLWQRNVKARSGKNHDRSSTCKCCSQWKLMDGWCTADTDCRAQICRTEAEYIMNLWIAKFRSLNCNRYPLINPPNQSMRSPMRSGEVAGGNWIISFKATLRFIEFAQKEKRNDCEVGFSLPSGMIFLLHLFFLAFFICTLNFSRWMSFPLILFIFHVFIILCSLFSDTDNSLDYIHPKCTVPHLLIFNSWYKWLLYLALNKLFTEKIIYVLDVNYSTRKVHFAPNVKLIQSLF